MWRPSYYRCCALVLLLFLVLGKLPLGLHVIGCGYLPTKTFSAGDTIVKTRWLKLIALALQPCLLTYLLNLSIGPLLDEGLCMTSPKRPVLGFPHPVCACHLLDVIPPPRSLLPSSPHTISGIPFGYGLRPTAIFSTRQMSGPTPFQYRSRLQHIPHTSSLSYPLILLSVLSCNIQNSSFRSTWGNFESWALSFSLCPGYATIGHYWQNAFVEDLCPSLNRLEDVFWRQF